jgi:uncharacterized membrane protein YoaT (DUF817 family)
VNQCNNLQDIDDHKYHLNEISFFEWKYFDKCFVHPILCFGFLVTFGAEIKKIQKYYVIFVYILQGKMGKKEKKQKENHATKVTKLPKTKRRKYGMNETNMAGYFCP